MDQDETWHAVGFGPGHLVLDGDPAPLPQRGTAPPPNLQPISVVAKWLNGLRCHFVWMEVGLGPGDFVLYEDPTPPPQKGGRAPQFSAHVYCGQTAVWIKMALGTKVGLGLGNIVC